MKPWSRLDWLIILIFAVLVALFYWRILTPNLADRQSFPPGDFHAQFWAFATFEVRELSAGRLPLWNPYTFAGAPFWADVQAAVFYPPSLLTLILSAPWGFSLFALEIEAIVHFWLAALLMYLFVRQLTQSRAAATISALTFTFSGYLTGYPSQQLAVLEADIWLPLILFFLHKTYNPEISQPTLSIPNFQSPKSKIQNPKSKIQNPTFQPATRFLLLAGLAWGMTLLAGHPQSALIVAYISLAYLIFLQFWNNQAANRLKPRLQSQNRPEPQLLAHLLRFTFHVLRFTFYALLFLLTGLGLAAIQFIPAVEYTLLSVRAEGTYDNMAGGFPITDIIQILLPGQVSFYSPLYVGVVGLILALAAVFISPKRHTIFWAIVAVVALLISFGGNSFLYSPLYLFTPGFSIFRGQERWAFATAFSLSILAGYGLKHLYHSLPPTPYPLRTTDHGLRTTPYTLRFTPYVLRFTQYLLLLALLLAFLFFYGLNDTGWQADHPFYNLLAASTLLTILLSLAWLLWRFWPYLHPALAASLTAALICFDLFSVNWQTNLYPQQPEWHTQMPAMVAAIKSDAAQWPDQSYRVYNEYRLYDNYGVSFEVEDLWGASPLRPRRYDQFLAPPMPIERTWELLNVKYVITWREALYLPSTIIYQEPAPDGTTYIHRLNAENPRAWLVGQFEIADDAAILQKIADPAFDRWRVALLEPGNGLDPAFLNEAGSAEGNGFQIARSVPDAVQHIYQINTPVPALLVMSEIYYPGWQATIDGRPAPVLRANYVLRAIPVPAGQHTIQMLFRPLSFTIGAIVSSLTVAALIAAFVLQRVRSVNRQTQPMSYEPQSQDAAAGS